MPGWIRGAGGPASGWCSSPTAQEAFEESRDWIAAHGIFPDGNLGAGRYDEATVSLA